ncbi:MAG: hypothetical protein U9N61_13145 [Euryarchaeota archaeon]|nr:hypothetical protein [Euryarchaeota archaeon]
MGQMSSEYEDFLAKYAGRDKAAEYIDGKITTANKSIGNAENRLAILNNQTSGLVQKIDEGLQEFNALPDWNIDDPEFDKNSLLNEKVPEDPLLRDLYPDPHVNPLDVDEWNLPSGIGDMPDDPEFKDVDTRGLDSNNLSQVDTTPLDALAPADKTDLAKITNVDTSGLDSSNLSQVDTTPLEALEPADRTDLDKITDVDTSGLDAVDRPDTSGLSVIPDIAMTFTPVEYTSELGAFLSSEIQALLAALENLENPVTVSSHVDLVGNTQEIAIVDDAIEEAVYDKAKTRLERERDRNIDQINATVQARGFGLPPGALSSLISDVQAKHSDAIEDLNNDIIATRVGLEQKRTEYELTKAGQITDAQYKHDTILLEYEKLNTDYIAALAEVKAKYIDSGVKLETMLIELHKNEEALRLEADKEDVEAALKIYNSKVESGKILMEIFKIDVDTVATKIKADTDYNQALLEIFKGKLEGSGIEADVAKSQVNADLDIRRADTELAVTQVKTDLDYNQAMLEIFKGKLEGSGIETEVAKTRVNADLDIRKADTELAVTQVKTDLEYNQAELAKFLGGIDAAKGGVDVERLKLEGKKTNADITNMEIMSQISVIEAENTRLTALANVYESDVRAYAAKMDGLKTAETLDLTRYESETKGKSTEITAEVQKATASVDAAIKAASLQIEALKSEATMAASIISSSLNSTNMSASYGYGGNLNGGFSNSQSIGYGYSYSGACEDVDNPEKEY